LAPVFGAAAESGGSVAASPAAARSLADKLREAFGAREAEVIPFLVNRQQIKAGESWEAVPEDYGNRVLSAPERFLQAVAEFKQAQEVAVVR
jgi:hypothetical protein